MTWQVLITVFTLGGIGSVIRGTVIIILAGSAGIFPAGTVIVNVLAAFLGGFISVLTLPEGIDAALAVGLVGGIGTLSAIPGNILDLIFDRGFRRLALYAALTVFLGVGSAAGGIAAGKMIVNMQETERMQTQLLIDALSAGADREHSEENIKALQQAAEKLSSETTPATEEQR